MAAEGHLLPTRKGMLWITLGIFFSILIGMQVAADYPVPMDEPTMLLLGSEAHAYILGKAPWPTNTDRRLHGPITELVLYKLQNIKFGDVMIMGEAQVLFRHQLLFLMFFAGVVALGVFTTLITKDWRIGAGSAVFLLLTPRFFAHAFMNSKDIPNVTYVTLAMLALYLLASRSTWPRLLFFGLALGLAMGSRLMNGFVLGIALLVLLGNCIWYRHAPHGRFLHPCVTLVLSLVAALLGMWLFWPFLWENPVAHFLEAVSYLNRNRLTFFGGQTLMSPPWNYHIVWILLTTPVLYSVLAVCGVVRHVRTAFTKRAWPQVRTLLMLVLWLGVPMLAAALSNSSDFNEWRHFFFMYPAVLLLAALGIKAIADSLQFRWRKWFARGLMAYCVYMALWMSSHHPFQFAYFTVPGSWVQGQVEIDYWALSTRSLLHWIVAHDDRRPIRLSAPDITMVNAYIFESDVLFVTSPPEQADYVIDYLGQSQYRPVLPENALLHSVISDGAVLSNLYRGPLYLPSKSSWMP